MLVLSIILLVFLGLSLWLAVVASKGLVEGLGLLLAWLQARRGGFDQLRPGPVALRGRIVIIDPVVSQETQRSGVYLSYVADRWERTNTIGGLSGQWMRAEVDAEAAPFELTDGEHSVLVEPEGAEFRVPPDRPLVLSQPGGDPVRYQESLLTEGDEVLVVGEVQEMGGFAPSEGYRGHGFRLQVAQGAGQSFYIASGKGLVRQLLGLVLWRAAALLPALVLGAFLVVLFFWNSRL